MSRGYGDVDGQIADVGRFVGRLRHLPRPMRWCAWALAAMFAVPLTIAVVLGVVELVRRW